MLAVAPTGPAHKNRIACSSFIRLCTFEKYRKQ
jgi:hypothetical protein